MKHTPRHSFFKKNFIEKLWYQRSICWFTSALFFDSNRCVRKRIRNTEHSRMINVYTIQIFKWEWIHFKCEIQNNSGFFIQLALLSTIEYYRMPFNTCGSFLILSRRFAILVSFRFSIQRTICIPSIGLKFERDESRLFKEKKTKEERKNRIYDFLIEEFYFYTKFGMYTDLWSIRREFLIGGKKQRKRYLSQPSNKHYQEH